jgi:hypothetical protein
MLLSISAIGLIAQTKNTSKIQKYKVQVGWNSTLGISVGYSRMFQPFNSEYYGINGREEAFQYINNPILRDRLIEITEAVYNNEKTVYEIFDHDAVKVRSCMQLFASVSDIPIFKQMLKKYCW